MAQRDGFGEVTLDHLRTLPDGSLTRAEVNLLIDYIERLERLVTAPRVVDQSADATAHSPHGTTS